MTQLVVRTHHAMERAYSGYTLHYVDEYIVQCVRTLRVHVTGNGVDRHTQLLQSESKWILNTGAMGPLGLNDCN